VLGVGPAAEVALGADEPVAVAAVAVEVALGADEPVGVAAVAVEVGLGADEPAAVAAVAVRVAPEDMEAVVALGGAVERVDMVGGVAPVDPAAVDAPGVMEVAEAMLAATVADAVMVLGVMVEQVGTVDMEARGATQADIPRMGCGPATRAVMSEECTLIHLMVIKRALSDTRSPQLMRRVTTVGGANRPAPPTWHRVMRPG
jgi:hypothetical protein